MAVASPIVYVTFIILIVAPGGGELGTRLMAFALVPGALICAFTIDLLLNPEARSRGSHGAVAHPKTRTPILLLMTAMLAVGAAAFSWPPFYARIPGPYVVGGRDRSVDQYDLMAAQWAALNLTPGNRIVADLTNSQLMDSIGRQSTAPGSISAYLLISTSITPALAKQIRSQNIQFVIADHRITTAIPVDGNPLFPDDPFADHYAKLIPAASLNKFNHIDGVSRLFDDGPIVIFDLRGSVYTAQRRR
jgi:hypothetical protein